ncbi:hypothetical protein KP509_35G027600 [Ceratopteris richardii]|uniref:THO1-MOS11 C-terminal domain-containing protein n=1 Tax=Ceratopteris richardii TaxID=49495 RepID=A0A8T2QFE3_CERRI|nr:hypothetical protein KP509_35G027600 [Ceratopteris richardii]
MASTAASSSPSRSKVDELRCVLASKGLVVKDSILARLAKSKSFNETLSFAPDAARHVETWAQNTANSYEARDGEFENSGEETAATVKGSEQNQESADNVLNASSGLTDGQKVKVLMPDERNDLISRAPLSRSSSEEDKTPKLREQSAEITEDEKLKKRASRFGITQDVIEDMEKKRARAARFGIVDDEAKKKARLERFGNGVWPEDEEENAKRKARALRFGATDELL